MPREGGQALGNGLLIANIRQNGIKGGEHTAVTGRNMKAALRHERQQSDGFQGDGFAAGIGACDDHGIKIRAQPQRNGNDLFGVDQRMPGVAQLYPALVVHDGGPGPHLIAQLGLCENHIQPDEHFHIHADVFCIGGSLCGELCQNALDFLFLLQLQLPQGVIGIYGRHGLYEVCRPCGGNIMHQSGHIVFALGFHGDHIAALANGDDGLPQKFAVSRGGNDLLKAVPDFPRLDAHMAADVCQGRGGGIGDLVLREDRAKNPVF